MMNKLKISNEISLPPDTVTQTIAILAKRRVGKSYTMRRIWEQLLEAKQQVITVDPKGDQWGIRSSIDGKKPGHQVIILGGEHGDVPLEANAGELVAKLAVEQRVNILLDLSSFRKHEVATFMTAFMENLYRLKAQEKYRTPAMLLVDEADAIAPQKPQKGEERMLGAIEDIVRRGGQRGLGCILVTQRSAVLNKNVLTQAEMLIVLRTIAPQDLAAMNAWIDVHGTLEQKKILMESLPSLPIGDAWFWSPGWPTGDGIFKRTHILPIQTFDSARTPKSGERKIIPRNMADVDLNVLKTQMAAVVEKAKAEDPKLLQIEVRKLKEQLIAAEKIKVTNSSVPAAMGVSQWMEYGKKYKYDNFFSEKIIKETEKRMQEVFWKEKDEWLKQIENWFKILEGLGKTMVEWKKQNPRTLTYTKITQPEFNVVKGNPVFSREALDAARNLSLDQSPKEGHKFSAPLHQHGVENVYEGSITAGAKNMLKVLVSRYPMKLTWVQVATFAKLKSSTGSYSTNKTSLRNAGMIIEEGDLVQASQAAIDLMGHDVSAPQSSQEIREMWSNSFTGATKKMFDHLVSVYPGIITREELAAAAGVKHTTGSYSTNLSMLRSNNLIVERDQELKLNDNLFI